MKVVAVIQARVGSKRLPGKIFKHVGAQVMLTHVLARAKAIPGVDEVHVTTTADVRDDLVANRCRGAGVGWSRGQVPLAPGSPRNDVLAGYVLAARQTGADVIVRITSDCPLLDPVVAGRVVTALGSNRQTYGYASNVCPPSWYDGCDVEVFTAEALWLADGEAEPDEREHVTTWMRAHPERVGVANVTCEAGDTSWIKLSVDTARDLARVRRVWDALPSRQAWDWRAVVEAYLLTHATPTLRQAVALYGAGIAARPRVLAYIRDVLAETGTHEAGIPPAWERQRLAVLVSMHAGGAC